MKQVLIYCIITVIVVSSVLLFIAGSDNDKLVRQQEFNSMYGVYAIDMPDTLSFAGEMLPLSDQDVKERLDRELLVNTYWQSQTLLLLKRKERWFSQIEPILKAKGIPDDFKYVALAESGFTHIVSPSGAAGYWQFLEKTARQYGLEVTDDVDERYNSYKASIAACRYFQDAYKQFGNWTLVAASYNMGMNGVQEAIDIQKASKYYNLLLPEETMRYLFRITALKEICNNPLKYGFHLRERDYYRPYDARPVTVDTTITDLASFASQFGMSYKSLKILNPWLRTNRLNNLAEKPYIILVTKKYSSDSSDLDTIQPEKEHHQE